MPLSFQKYTYTVALIFIFLVKIMFMVLSLINVYFKRHDKDDTQNAHKVLYWKEKTNFIFAICMALLLIYYFGLWVHPVDLSHSCDQSLVNKKMYEIDSETKTLFFMFGIITLTTADWTTLFKI